MSTAFGTRIRDRRNRLGLTQDGLRVLLQRHGVMVSGNTVSMWETGQRRPSKAHLVPLLDVLAIHGDARLAALEEACGAAPLQAGNRPGGA